jgi:hypothetical protein
MPMLDEMIAAVKSGQFALPDGGRQTMSTSHVDNVVGCLIIAAERGRGGQAYFFADGDTSTLKDFTTALLATRPLHWLGEWPGTAYPTSAHLGVAQKWVGWLGHFGRVGGALNLCTSVPRLGSPYLADHRSAADELANMWPSLPTSALRRRAVPPSACARIA